jgi:imidazolonepropionase-like amidohydrolase
MQKDHSRIALTGVNIISLETGEVLHEQTVVVTGQTLTAVGRSADIQVPTDAEVVDGRGKYVLPGLVDMHVHISSDDDLLLLLANGVTTVRNMADIPGWVKFFFGFSDILSLRRKVKEGRLLGPDIYTAGPVLDGTPPVSPFNKVIKDPAKIEKEIIRQKKAGYDYIKIYDILTEDHFGQIMRAASKHAMPVIGHVPFKAGLDTILESPVVSIEHMTGYINNNKADFIIPADHITEYSRKTQASGIYNCPTLVIWDKLPPPNGVNFLKQYDEFRFLSWRVEWLWKRSLKTVYEVEYSPKTDYARRMMDISKQMVRALYEAGCKLLVGTDMNFIGVFPGKSALREMELLVEAGIPPIDVLRAATVEAARCLRKDDIFGTIAPGKRADLLLLDRNPLEDIRNIYATAGVMVRGRWFDKKQIDQWLRELKK